MRHSEYLAAPIMPFLGLSHLDEFLGSQSLLSLGFLHSWVAAKTLTRHKQTASNIPKYSGSISRDHSGQAQPQAGSARAGCSGPCSAEFGISSMMSTSNLPGSTGQMLLLSTLMALSCPPSSMSKSFLLWGAQNWAQLSHWSLTRAGHRGMITSCDFLAMLFLMQPRMLLGLSANIDVYRCNRILRTWWVMYFQGLLYIKEIQTILFC